MASNWTNLSLAAPAEPIKDIASGISKVTNAIATAIGIQKAILSFLSTFALDLLNAEALIIKTALSVLEDTLKQYVETDAKMHVLVVPIRKRPVYSLVSDYQMPEEEDSWTINDAIDSETKKELQEALERVSRYDQGNEGFARTVIEATYDELDPNAPTYDSDDAVHAVVFLCGAQTMLGVYDLLRALQGVLGTALKGNPMIPNTLIRTAQDLKAKPIATKSSPRIGTMLSWTNPPALQVLTEFAGTRVRIDEIAIIRSTNDEVANAKDWMAIFGGNQPTALDDDETEQEDALDSDDELSSVIRIFKYDSVRNSYVDDDEDLEKKTNYYYAVAYRYAIADEPTNDETPEYEAQDYHQISNVVKVQVKDEVPSVSGGPKPDWFTHPSPLEMIPDLKFLMALLQNQISALKSQTTGAASALSSYVKFLAAEAQRYSDFAEEINNKVAKLSALLQIPSTGIYITTISSSKGGVDYFLQELTRRLTDESDTSAPPFFRTGFTAGMVLLLGAPNPAEFASTKALLDLLFGSSSTQTAFEEAVDSLDRLLDDLEDKTFGADMQEGTAPTAASRQKTFKDDMTAVDADDADANVPFDP